MFYRFFVIATIIIAAMLFSFVSSFDANVLKCEVIFHTEFADTPIVSSDSRINYLSLCDLLEGSGLHFTSGALMCTREPESFCLSSGDGSCANTSSICLSHVKPATTDMEDS